MTNTATVVDVADRFGSLVDDFRSAHADLARYENFDALPLTIDLKYAIDLSRAAQGKPLLFEDQWDNEDLAAIEHARQTGEFGETMAEKNARPVVNRVPEVHDLDSLHAYLNRNWAEGRKAPDPARGHIAAIQSAVPGQAKVRKVSGSSTKIVDQQCKSSIPEEPEDAVVGSVPVQPKPSAVEQILVDTVRASRPMLATLPPATVQPRITAQSTNSIPLPGVDQQFAQPKPALSPVDAPEVLPLSERIALGSAHKVLNDSPSDISDPALHEYISRTWQRKRQQTPTSPSAEMNLPERMAKDAINKILYGSLSNVPRKPRDESISPRDWSACLRVVDARLQTALSFTWEPVTPDGAGHDLIESCRQDMAKYEPGAWVVELPIRTLNGMDPTKDAVAAEK
jgi:hypothetical protein